MSEDCIPACTSAALTSDVNLAAHANRNQTTFYHSPPGPQLAQYSALLFVAVWRSGVQLAESCKRMSCTLAMTQVTPHAGLSIDCWCHSCRAMAHLWILLWCFPAASGSERQVLYSNWFSDTVRISCLSVKIKVYCIDTVYCSMERGSAGFQSGLF